MDTKDKTPPAGVVEEEFSAEESAMHNADVKKFAELKAKIEGATPDDDLPHVQSEQSTI